MGQRQRCATTCRHVHGNHGVLLRLRGSFVDVQNSRSACASRRALCRSAASHLESHNAPLGAAPYQSGNFSSVLGKVNMGFGSAIKTFRSSSAHPIYDASTAVSCAADWSALASQALGYAARFEMTFTVFYRVFVDSLLDFA